MQLGNTRDLYVLRQEVYERFLFSAYNARVLAKMLYTNMFLNSDRRFILRSEEGLNSFNNKNTVLTFLVKKRSFPGCLFFDNIVLVKVSQNHFHGLLRILVSSLFDSEDDYRTEKKLSKRRSLSTTTVLFRTTFTRTIKLDLLLK